MPDIRRESLVSKHDCSKMSAYYYYDELIYFGVRLSCLFYVADLRARRDSAIYFAQCHTICFSFSYTIFIYFRRFIFLRFTAYRPAVRKHRFASRKRHFRTIEAALL